MGTQMREHLTEEEDVGLALLRQHFSEKEVAPVSLSWHLLNAFPFLAEASWKHQLLLLYFQVNSQCDQACLAW